MVHHDRLIDWDAHPRRSGEVIVDDRILTSCAVACARMDGWWTVAAGTVAQRSVPIEEETVDRRRTALNRRPVLMDQSPDPPVGAETQESSARDLWPFWR